MAQPYVPFADVAQVTLNMLWRGIPVANVFHFRHLTAGITEANLIDLGIVTRNFYQDAYQDGQTNDCVLTSIRMVDLTTNTSGAFTYTAGLPLTGLTPGDSVPNNTALVISANTFGRGRSAHGRTYLAGLDKAQVAENNWNSTYANIFLTSFNTFLDTFNVAGWVWGVASRRLNNAWRTTGLFQPITNFEIKSLLVGTMRERLH